MTLRPLFNLLLAQVKPTLALLALGLCACSSSRPTPAQTELYFGQALASEVVPIQEAEYLVQGMIGLTRLNSLDIDLADPSDSVRDDGLDSLPMIGGVWQTLIRRGLVDFGFECGFTAGWDSDRGTATVNNGALIVESDVRVLGVEAFVGLHVNIWLSDRLRLYAGAGPLLQYAALDVEYLSGSNLPVVFEENGFGGGGYGRLGVEYALTPFTLVGLGVRRLESGVSLDGGLRDVDFTATQVFLSVTRSF